MVAFGHDIWVIGPWFIHITDEIKSSIWGYGGKSS